MTIQHGKWTAMKDQVVFHVELDTRAPFAVVTVHTMAAPDDVHVVEVALGALKPVALTLAGKVLIDGSMLLRTAARKGESPRVELVGDLRLSQLNSKLTSNVNQVLFWAPQHEGEHERPHVDMSVASVTPADHDGAATLARVPAPVPENTPAAGALEELFPYIYLNSGAPLDAACRRRCFAEVPEAVLATPFLAQAAALPTARERQILALQYMTGRFDGDDVFVAHPGQLQGLIRDFPMVPALLRAPHLAPATAVAEVARHFGRSPGELAGALAAPDYVNNLSLLWQSWLALLLADADDASLLAPIGALLLTAHWLDYLLLPAAPGTVLDQDSLAELLDAALVLPEELSDGATTSAVAGRLQMVRQRFLRHEFGDLASVESVMPRERRELARKRSQVQVDQHAQGTLATHTDSADASDTRTSLASQVRQAVAEQAVQNQYDKFQTTYGPPAEATLGGKWTVYTLQGKKPGIDDSIHFARDILNRTVNSIRQEVSQQRVRHSIDQEEESQLSVIDNSQGQEQLVCARRWINTVFEASVHSYGQRLMVEVVLRSPTDTFRIWQDAATGVQPLPVPLTEAGLASFADVTPDNYALLAAAYEVTQLAPPPAAVRVVSVTLRAGDDRVVPVPPGYRVTGAAVNWIGPATGSIVLVGGALFPNPQAGTTSTFGQEAEIAVAALALTPATVAVLPDPAPPAAAAAPLTPAAPGAFVSITLDCAPTPASLDAWRIQTYSAILAGYQHQAASARRSEPDRRSAQAQRRALHAALRDACIGHLLHAAAARIDPDGVPDVLADRRAIQLLDDAFEWDEMNVRFFHQPDANMVPAERARVLIPAAPQYAIALLYFLDCGRCWPLDVAAAPVHATHLALAHAIAHPGNVAANAPPAPWQVRVPTAMQALDPHFRIEHDQEGQP
jgi:hypothetical protein